jgi:hypothetical protein
MGVCINSDLNALRKIYTQVLTLETPIVEDKRGGKNGSMQAKGSGLNSLDDATATRHLLYRNTIRLAFQRSETNGVTLFYLLL